VLTQAAGQAGTRPTTHKSTHIVSASEASDPINHQEHVNLIGYNEINEPFNTVISINKFTPTSDIILIELLDASRPVSLKTDVFRSLA
jgi:hypothetical protein